MSKPIGIYLQKNYRKLRLTECDLHVELCRGIYLIDGVLNDSFIKIEGGEEVRYSTVPDEETWDCVGGKQRTLSLSTGLRTKRWNS